MVIVPWDVLCCVTLHYMRFVTLRCVACVTPRWSVECDCKPHRTVVRAVRGRLRRKSLAPLPDAAAVAAALRPRLPIRVSASASKHALRACCCASARATLAQKVYVHIWESESGCSCLTRLPFANYVQRGRQTGLERRLPSFALPCWKPSTHTSGQRIG